MRMNWGREFKIEVVQIKIIEIEMNRETYT